MSAKTTKSCMLCCAMGFAAVALVGCGGGESRKTRHLEKGETFFAAGNFEKARIEFRNALQIAPTDSEARFENGVVDEKLGNPREAASFYQGAIDSNLDNVPARAALGRLYLFSGAAERALDTIKPALLAHPEDAGLLTVRAAARTQLKDPEGALQDAEHAVKLDPNNEDAVAVLAGIYTSRSEPERARVLLESTIKRVPATVDLRLALAQLYAQRHEEPKVEALLIEIAQLRPGEKSQRLRLAQYYARLNRIDDAERVLRAAIHAMPNEKVLKSGLIDLLATRRSREVAAKELDTMIAANPKNYELKLESAQFYEQGKEYPKAEVILGQIISDADFAAPGIAARNQLAALKIQTGNTAAAQQLLDAVLAKSPRDNDALILRGNLALAEQDPKTAIVDLRAVLRDQPNAVAVMRTLSRAHMANREPALAEETLRRAVDTNPKDPGARLDLALLLAQSGKPEQARPIVDSLVREQPNNLGALDTQFRVAAATNDTSTAKAAADAIVALQPKSGLGYYYQGLAAEADKHPDEALRLFTRSLDLQPDGFDPLQALTRLLVRLDRTPEALQRLDATAAQFPKLPLALNMKGEVLLGQHRPTEAETAFKAAITREPNWWTPYRGLALAQQADHDGAAAVVTLRSGIAAVADPAALQMELAGVLEREGNADEAIALYDRALHADPSSDIAANNLAMLLITYKTDRASLDRAKGLTERFAQSPNSAYLDTFGWVLFKRGDSAAAVATLQSALLKSPDAPVLLYHLGMAEVSAGQSDAARDSLARSLKSGRNFSGMDEAKATLDKLATLPTSAAPQS